jgi:hypothetical protein
VVWETVIDCSRRLLPQLSAKQAKARIEIKGDARRGILIATSWRLRALRQLRSCLPSESMTPAEVEDKTRPGNDTIPNRHPLLFSSATSLAEFQESPLAAIRLTSEER